MTEEHIKTKEEAIKEFKDSFNKAVSEFQFEPIRTVFSKEEMQEIIDNWINDFSDEDAKINKSKNELYYETEDYIVTDKFVVENEQITIYREAKFKKPIQEWIEIDLKVDVSNKDLKVAQCDLK